MIYLILLLSLILRLIQSNQSLWLDEAINIVAAQKLDLISFVTRYPVGDFHPPGYFLILWIWGRIFGFSELAARFPSIIFGVLSVYITYLIGEKLFSKKVGLLAALFLSIGPLHIFYSQEARMYSFAVFSVALSCYFLLKILGGSKWGSVGYLFSTLAVFYSDYLAYLVIPAQLFYLFWFERKKLAKVIILLLLSIVGLLPWLIVFPEQLSTGRKAAQILTGWSRVVGGANLKNLLLVILKTEIGRVTMLNKFIYFMIGGVISIFYGFIIFWGIKKMSNSNKILLCWLVIPVILAFVISFYIPVLSYFRMIFILPAFYLLLAKGIISLPKIAYMPALLFIVLISLISISAYYLNPEFQREDWKNAVNFVGQKNNTITILESNAIFSPFLYYQNDSALSFAGLKNIPVRSVSDVADLKPILIQNPDIYLFEYLVEITDSERLLEKEIFDLGYKQSSVYNFPGVGFVTLYSAQ